MEKVVKIYKKEGQTPLQALDAFRAENPEYKNVPMTYAGRLDPMAEGLLLVLAGEVVHEKEKYLKLEKVYKFEVLFGFATDTYDILGKAINSKVHTNIGTQDFKKLIKENLSKFKGKFVQKYPMYSSKTVAGEPLFEYARAGESVEIPAHEVEVKKLKLRKVYEISASDLLQDIKNRISKVGGDFRQEEILKIWREDLQNSDQSFYIAKFKAKCSSGTYIRAIANDLGEAMGVPALAHSIKRTKVGKYRKPR